MSTSFVWFRPKDDVAPLLVVSYFATLPRSDQWFLEPMLRCDEVSSGIVAMGQKLPRSLGAVMSVVPPKAAATIADWGAVKGR